MALPRCQRALARGRPSGSLTGNRIFPIGKFLSLVKRTGFNQLLLLRNYVR